MKLSRRVLWVALFAVAFAFVESAVVDYLRALYYPEGFSLPLKLVSIHHLRVELAREFSTLLMLLAVGFLAGTTRWSRFAFFAVAFGVWDIFYYVWLKVILGWPASLLDWDVLFLLPIPWLGPVLAPLVVSVLLIVAGLLVLQQERTGIPFTPGRVVWQLAITGTIFVLVSFMWDIDASVNSRRPTPYHYEFLALGVISYVLGMIEVIRKSKAEVR